MEFLSLRLLLFFLVSITSANFCFISMADYSPQPYSPPTTPPSSTTSPPNTTSTPKIQQPTSRTHPVSSTPPSHKHNTSSTPSIPPPRRSKSPSPPTSRTHPSSTTSPHNTSSTPIIAPPSPSRTHPPSTTSPQNTTSTPIMQVPETPTTPPASTISPPNTYSTPIIPSPSTPQEVSSETQEKQLLHIIDELVGAGNFASWAKFLASINPAMFPVAATLFVPSNAALTSLTNATIDDVFVVDPSLLEYHIVPQYLPFSELKQLPLNSRIPTLLSTNFIIITNTSSNFTIDDSEVTHPDLYISKEFSVHGVSKILDYKAYGAVNITFNEVDVADSGPDERMNPVNETTNEPKYRNHKHFPNNPAYLKPRFSGASSYSISNFVMIFLVLEIALFFKID
ncbi:hypothetical protein LIER_35292 [Lithospermum erythrorhizon]|uniref:FAS1 domain-containing protein n=1 Tax=Lithospermum erythrorhizon TaxID=34254 RepID=A0AAV3NNQ6_LITER